LQLNDVASINEHLSIHSVHFNHIIISSNHIGPQQQQYSFIIILIAKNVHT